MHAKNDALSARSLYSGQCQSSTRDMSVYV